MLRAQPQKECAFTQQWVGNEGHEFQMPSAGRQGSMGNGRWSLECEARALK